MAKETSKAKSAYLGFRLPEEENKALEAAAAAAGESISEYVRKAIASRIETRMPQLPEISMSYEIFPVKIADITASQFQSHTPTVTVHDIQVINLPAQDKASQKSA